MSVSEVFIRKPVATTLLTLALALAGAIAFRLLPVAPLPQVEFPTIQVQATLPGASPETMASSVATPLERQFGRIANLTELTSTSYLGATSIVLQFDLNRNIDAAARDVQAAINAAAGQLPTTLPSKPTYRKVNPADAPIMILGLTSTAVRPGLMYDAADSILEQKLSQIDGVGQVNVGGSALPGVRVELNPTQMSNLGVGLEDVRTVLANANANRPKGELANNEKTWGLSTTDQLLKAEDYQPLIVRYNNGAAVQLSDIGLGKRLGRERTRRRDGRWQACSAGHHFPPTRREHYRYRRSNLRGVAPIARFDPGRDRPHRSPRPHDHHPRLGA